ncbi:hypothetical protein GOP47_0020246 [Adiantum capillus-veneris]|uniref:NAD(P)-binding domain-containing protein n=1 Tax=Adiantum capillus-veneris TaxID=13818 RepID=A0A9D4UE62_ADICA|nr:hypothetical protein GOP47_0020246 [Adiantum capillus-veneris]
MASIATRTVLPDLLSHQKDEAVKHTLRSSSLLASCTPSVQRQPSSRRNLQCAAVTGGSKRDVEKLVAKTQHRRPRHRKGVTPSKPDLMEELEEEEAAEEDVPKEVAQLMNGDSKTGSSADLSEDASNGSLQPEDRLRSDSQAEDTLQGNGNQKSDDSSVSNAVNDAAEGVKGVLETTEDTAKDVVDKSADTQKQVVSDAVAGGESLVGSITDAVNEQSSSSSSDSEKELADDIGNSVRTLADVTSDTTLDVGTRVNETGEQVQQDVAEVASNVEDTLKSQTNSALDNFSEQASEVQASAKAVADVAADTTSYVNKKVGETGEQLGQDLSEVVSTGQRLVQNNSDVMRAQAKDFISQAESVLEEEGNLLQQGATRIEREANKSLGRVQDSVQKAVRESARAARDVGMEALGMGELLMDTAKETIQGTSAMVQNEGMRINAQREQKGNGSLTEKPQNSQQEDRSNFTGFKVLVAGASGQTGRLVVENLVSEGASVRALVRDVYKARAISQLKDCECVEADLYNYEAVKRAIGDCNVVICAIGARAFAFDPFNTYQVEYEGVLNLISAAKNQGKVKKFVLISTIGVTYFQLVPLIFWKKQAELYLQRSGLNYTIVRPGGLRNTNGPEDVVMQGADSQFFGGISRKKVAEVCVSALVSSDASDKIVEVVAVPGSQRRSIVDLFKQV